MAYICSDTKINKWTPPRKSGFSLNIPGIRLGRLKPDGTAEPASGDQILRRERGQGNIHFPCSADHEQDWQPYSVDPYSSNHLLIYSIHTGIEVLPVVQDIIQVLGKSTASGIRYYTVQQHLCS